MPNACNAKLIQSQVYTKIYEWVTPKVANSLWNVGPTRWYNKLDQQNVPTSCTKGANSQWNVGPTCCTNMLYHFVGPTFYTNFGVGVNSVIVDSFACQTCWYNKVVQHSNKLI